MTETLNVPLEDRSYPIYFNQEDSTLKATIDNLHHHNKACYLITDSNLYSLYSDYIERLGIPKTHIYTVPAGETSKSVEHFEKILSFLASHSANRDASIFAFGGGVIGDLAGFVAASYLRGIDFYQIPTSLLAMVDSSVGGKTGINLPEGKNLVGAFWQPHAVFINQRFLKTLPEKQFASGMSEVIKYGLLADKGLFDQLVSIGKVNFDDALLPSIIRRCCEIKAEIVSNDEKEIADTNGRALLNLGHTFGHAIENVAGYGDYLHGEAIAIGLNLACRLSEMTYSSFNPTDTEQTIQLLRQNGLPTVLNQPLEIQALNKAISRDKKNRAGGIRFVLMESLGNAQTKEGIDEADINALWKNVGAAE
jgi:3-dehydroquinate synthase